MNKQQAIEFLFKNLKRWPVVPFQTGSLMVKGWTWVGAVGKVFLVSKESEDFISRQDWLGSVSD